jgi:EAL and modified HD-GYP domain-containing signal transduction protein
LSFHLLKLANSAALGLTPHITSFGQAITLLGRRQLQRWLQLLLYARQQPDGLPNLLLPLAALRGAQLAALCEREGGGRDEQDMAFMAGVFSLLHLLFGMPMSDIITAPGLPPSVSGALLGREGRLGQLLTLVETPAPAAAALQAAGVERDHWWESQLHAWRWAIQVGRSV